MKKKHLIRGLAAVLPALLAFQLFSGASTASGSEESLIDQLGWMEGRWISESDGQYIEETWSPARDDAMVGSLRWSRGGKVWLYELMSIEEEDDQLVFRLRHFDRSLVPWKSEAEGPLAYPLENFGENTIVFENPEKDEPRRFVYERKGDELSIRLEKPDGEATNAFRMRRDS